MRLDLRRLFKKEKQEHRILRQIARAGETVQPEYHRATPECAHPERWSMFDSIRPEFEVLDFRFSLGMKVDGRIDLFFRGGDLPVRGHEVRPFLPQISPYGVIVLHDASSPLKIVREAALKLEREGLISVVLLPPPRGLVVAQKRE